VSTEAPRTPGQLIASLLTARGWNNHVLAAILGVSAGAVSHVITGRRRIDAQMALALGDVFGIQPEQFLELQQAYELATARLAGSQDSARANRATIFGEFPIPELMRRGWLQVSNIHDIGQIESELVRFFQVSRLSDIKAFPHAAKKTDITAAVSPSQLAWIQRVKQIAGGLVVAPYSRRSVLRAIKELESLLRVASDARKAPRLLADAGVRLVMVETLKGARIDGVCLWLDDASPVIGLSLRFDRIDNFWFLLRHELEHILRGDGKDAALLDTELEGDRAGVGDSLPEQERAANGAAADFCVASESLSDFISRKEPIFTERDLLGFSRIHGVHPGIVAGQIQRRTGRYDLFRKHLVKVRDAVLPNAMVDGWGDVPPIFT